MNVMLKTGIFIATFFLSFIAHSYALTEKQKMGIYRHGIWEWSIKTCPNILRNKGYWFALKEVGEFKNADQIIQSENTTSFLEGWNYMVANAEKFGLEKTCQYAIEQWPAVLWSESAQQSNE